MNSAVLDASVILKWFHQAHEPDIEAALLLRDALLDGSLTVIAPDLLVYELSNILRFKAGYTAKDVEDMVEALYLSDIAIQPVNQTVAKLAAQFSYVYEITYYDAYYVALAQALPAPFITAEKKLHKHLKGVPGVLLLSEL